MGHRAFTLIELLVVIAIIAILCSILTPVLGGCGSSPRETQITIREKDTVSGSFLVHTDQGTMGFSQVLFSKGEDPASLYFSLHSGKTYRVRINGVVRVHQGSYPRIEAVLQEL